MKVSWKSLINQSHYVITSGFYVFAYISATWPRNWFFFHYPNIKFYTDHKKRSWRCQLFIFEFLVFLTLSELCYLGNKIAQHIFSNKQANIAKETLWKQNKQKSLRVPTISGKLIGFVKDSTGLICNILAKSSGKFSLTAYLTRDLFDK